MEVKATLQKPYTDKQRMDFIVEYNHGLGYTINETDTGLQALGDTQDEKAEDIRNQLIEGINYQLKADIAYTGVRFDYYIDNEPVELIFETNKDSMSLINFTITMLQTSGATSVPNWKCRKTTEPYEPVAVTFTKEQFTNVLNFASVMVTKAFAVEDKINTEINALTTDQLSNTEFVEAFKQNIEQAYATISTKIDDLFQKPETEETVIEE